MSAVIAIRGGALTPEALEAIAFDGARVELAAEARARLAASLARLQLVEQKLGPVPLWKLADLADEPNRRPNIDAGLLAKRILLDHAAAVGRPLPTALVRAAMAVRLDVFAQGVSGVRPELAETLTAMLNAGVHPLVPSRGHFSVAGDTAPLAHIALALCGANHGGWACLGRHEDGAAATTGEAAMRAAGLTPLAPTLKESFSLVVGTSLSAAWAALLLREAQRLFDLALAATALTCEAVCANLEAYDEAALRLGSGREAIARVGERLRAWTAGSSLAHRGGRGDAFSIRCAPQVLGAAWETIERSGQTIRDELQLASDNPLLLDGPDGPRCFDSGAFHGARLANALDGLRAAMAQVGALSERHSFLLTNGARNNGLPSFLIHNRGLNSGFMLAQYTAAALASENKALALPYATDSIPSCQDYEDYAGLSSHSAAATQRLLDGVRRIVAIELLLAAQGADLRLADGGRLGAEVARVHATIRAAVPHWTEDTALYRQIEAVEALCGRGGALVR